AALGEPRVRLRHTAAQRDQRKLECPGDERRHLRARDRVIRAVVRAATAVGDAPAGQLTDVLAEASQAADVVEAVRLPGWRGRLQRLQDEYRHLRTRDGVLGAEVALAATVG